MDSKDRIWEKRRASENVKVQKKWRWGEVMEEDKAWGGQKRTLGVRGSERRMKKEGRGMHEEKEEEVFCLAATKWDVSLDTTQMHFLWRCSLCFFSPPLPPFWPSYSKHCYFLLDQKRVAARRIVPSFLIIKFVKYMKTSPFFWLAAIHFYSSWSFASTGWAHNLR